MDLTPFNEALKENVSRFMYISAFNANRLRHLEIVKAKERFADELKAADIGHIIVRPNGFFSDMHEFFNMAKRGRVYLFGPIEFFMTVMAMDMIAPTYGRRTIKNYFKEIKMGR